MANEISQMRWNKRIIVFFQIALIFLSCQRYGSEKNLSNDHPDSKDTVNVCSFTPVEILYAEGFRINSSGRYKEIETFYLSGEKKRTSTKYVLLPRNIKYEGKTGKKNIIPVPVKKVVCLSTTHVAMIDLIDEHKSIVGLSSPSLVTNKRVSELIKQKKISEVGYEQNINFELLISLQPDVVFVYRIKDEPADYIRKMEELGLNVVTIAEYKEEDVLAKTEWIKFVAAFYNKEKLADSCFSKIEQEYNRLKKRVTDNHLTYRPYILSGLPWKGIWYVPGGKSHIAKLIEDAGGHYVWRENNSRESFSVDMETVFKQAVPATIWINTGTAKNKKDILSVDERLVQLNVFQNGNMYNNNARLNKNGGNDYWETGIVEPHIILGDLIRLFHPRLMPEYKIVYYKELF